MIQGLKRRNEDGGEDAETKRTPSDKDEKQPASKRSKQGTSPFLILRLSSSLARPAPPDILITYCFLALLMFLSR